MDRRTFAGFTIPSVLIMVMLMAVPLITTVYLSFNRIFLRDLNDRQWIGFENYTEVLSDPAFWDAFKLTILFVAIVVPAHLVLGFGLPTEGLNNAGGRQWTEGPLRASPSRVFSSW